MIDAYGTEIKEGQVVIYSAGSRGDHEVKIGVVTGFSVGASNWDTFPIVRSYDKSYGNGVGRTGMPSLNRCVVVPFSAIPEKAQVAFREYFPQYFASLTPETAEREG